eukprot:scaffold1308_cov93-Cylindrotheca_fusiformis.AAC.2
MQGRVLSINSVLLVVKAFAGEDETGSCMLLGSEGYRHHSLSFSFGRKAQDDKVAFDQLF